MFNVNEKVTIEMTVNWSIALVNKFEKTLHFFHCFNCRLDKRVNIFCSYGSISRPMIMTMTNCFYGIVSQRKVCSPFSAGTIIRDPHH